MFRLDVRGEDLHGAGKHCGIVGIAEHRNGVRDQIVRHEEIDDRANERELHIERRLRSNAQ